MLKNNARSKFAAQLLTFLSAVLFLTTAVFAADGGLFQVTVEKDPLNPIAGITVYLFDENGTYLGLNQVSDSTGTVGFNLSQGTYRVRADYLGYQFWSDNTLVTADTDITLAIPHQDVTITVEGDYLATEPIAGVPVYLFTAAGAYMSQNQTADANGQVVFNLPEQPYKVRADYMAQQYWSNPFTWLDTVVTVPMAEADILVTGSGLPLAGVNVYVFTASDTYLGLTDATDANGRVTFRLAGGNYKFRADYQSSQYWSAAETLTAGQVNPVNINTGGGVFSFTVFKGISDPLVGVNCYVFNETGTYLGMTAVTSSEGLVTFNLADGSYKFRVDYLGYQFWSPVYIVPGTLSASLTIPHQDVTITVEGDYLATEPIAGVPVYLFTAAGAYMSQNQTTAANGQVVFNLPEQPYKVRADYMAQQYWSNEFTWQDTAITVPMADAEVQVTGSGLPLEGVNVYVFTTSNTYLNQTKATDASGTAIFRLPAGAYKFRADYQSSQYWSAEELLTAGQVNPVNINTGGGEFSFTVLKGVNDHLAGVNCYVFTEGGTYLGMTDVTSSEGLVTFNLAVGSYKFRVDYLGYQFWSQVYIVPGTLSATLTIPHQDVTITVEGDYPATEPIEGVPVYLFTAAGAYMNQNQTTAAGGQVVFNLPEQPYKVRVDHLAQQFWSGGFTWQNTSVTIDRGLASVHVTRSGSDVAGAKVYLFSENDAYLGWFETTDESGNAEFLLPDRSFKFRADEGPDQKYSPVIGITAGVINNVEIDLAPLTLTITADPESIPAGSSSTLSWNSTGADTCVIEPDIGTVDVNGSILVTPSATTTYTITATGIGGTAVDSVEVIVIANLEDVDYGLDYNEQQGGGGLVGETVRILNGNAIVSRSDLSFPTPNNLGLSFGAAYNSRFNFSGALGFGWTHTYSALLDTEVGGLAGSFIRIVGETGRGHYFNEAAAGVFEGFFNERSLVKLEAGEYVWYRLDGSRYGFSAAGKLLWIEDEKGNELALAYDALGKLETVTDTASGRALTFHYVNNLLDHISGPVTTAVSNGIWVSYGYDANQNLTSVTYADGSGVTYSYTDPNDNHNLTEKRNAANHLLGSWSYDSQDRCSAQSNPGGTDVTVAYVSAGQVDVTDAYGTVRSYTIAEIDEQKRVTARQGLAAAPYDAGNLVRWQYDAQLNLVEIETAGGTIHQYQDHDIRGNPATVILAAGEPEERMITYTYHPEMNLPLTRSEPSVLGSGDKITIWDYDDDYDTTANENPTNLPARVIEQGFTKDAAGATVAYEYVTTLTYNIKGQLLTVDGPLAGTADTTQFGYAAATGNLLSITRPLVGSTSFADYDAAGQAGRVTDVNSQSETVTYDGRGRITAVTHEADASTTTVSYNTAGLPDSATDEDDITKSYEYNANGRLYRLYDADGNYLQYLYDTRGNLIERAKHEAGSARTGRKRWTYQHPNLPGKLYKEIKADDGYAQYGYDGEGNLSAVTDFNGNTTSYGYDALNRVITVAQPGSILTSYDYDLHGNLTSVLDAESHETTYTYDDMGRVVATISPDSGTTIYVYDAAGNPVQKTDAKNISVQYDYDDLRRLTAVRFPDTTQDITYSYDAGSFGVGRRSGMVDPAGATGFEYDSRGRLIGKDSTIAGYSYSISRGFTPGGRLNSLVYPSGRTIDYTRYGSGRIQTVATTYNSATVNLVNNLSYNPFGPAKGLGIGSGGTVNNTTNQSGNIEVINPGEQMEQVYTYDGNRNLLTIRGTNTPWYNQDFGYDALNRLFSADGIYGAMDFTYDDVGNRLTRTVDSQADTYTYQPGTSRLAQITGANPAAFSYDANGNITDIDSKTYVYNQNNRLVRVEEGLDILGQYTYNGSGQRQIKEVAGVATLFHYNFDGNIIAESLADGTMTVEYLQVDQSRMAMVNFASGALYFFHNNYLGTPVLMTDTTGTVVWEADYKPFGEAGVNPNSTVVNNFRFAGQYYDEETGLHYNYHRYYDPRAGRYLTPDPIGLAGGINLYTYVGGNPVNLVDPLGLATLHYWAPGGTGKDKWHGHVSLTLDDGTTYISHWPASNEKYPYILPTEPRPPSMKSDIEGEGGRLPLNLKINALDEDAIKIWFGDYNDDFSVWNNCSHAVTEALEVGGMDLPNYLIHDPEQVYNAVVKSLDKRVTDKTSKRK